MVQFQRIGASSNSAVGRAFEIVAQQHFSSRGIALEVNYKLKVGINAKKKEHAFDLGSVKQKIVVECKSHKWTTGQNVPSAKLTVWNEVMYYFTLVPKKFKKVLFVLRDYNAKR